MIDHTGVTVSDYKKSKIFYENVTESQALDRI